MGGDLVMKSSILCSIGLVVLLALIFCFYGVSIAKERPLSNLDVEIFKLQKSSLKLSDGRFTFLYFMQPGCFFCEEFERLALVGVLEKISSLPNTTFQAVGYGDPDSLWNKGEMYGISILLGTDKIWEVFELVGVPSFFIIDPDGKILWNMVGFPNDEDVNLFISALSLCQP
mgnify:CR=1 FL=1